MDNIRRWETVMDGDEAVEKTLTVNGRTERSVMVFSYNISAFKDIKLN